MTAALTYAATLASGYDAHRVPCPATLVDAPMRGAGHAAGNAMRRSAERTEVRSSVSIKKRRGSAGRWAWNTMVGAVGVVRTKGRVMAWLVHRLWPGMAAVRSSVWDLLHRSAVERATR
jgi:hypothetical protein